LITELPFELPGHIFVSAMPFGLYDPKGHIYPAYQQAAVQTVVVLSSLEEMLEKAGQDLRVRYLQDGLQVIYLPIEDFDVPDGDSLQTALDEVISLGRDGQNIAIHCSAGIGRTGLFASCLAKQLQNCSGEEAIRWVRKFIPAAVEMPDQMRFVYDFRREGPC
jgi:protein-tyrosine phosphatase